MNISKLGKPLTKLIEVISEGVGNVSHSYLVRKNADAKAYEIKRIAEAISENKKSLETLEYKNGKVIVAGQSNKKEAQLAVDDDNRISARLSHQENKKQENIEHITNHAAAMLGQVETVSDKPVDDDWTTRFFKITEDISSEEMQLLWGKILAGEVVKPGTYSLRTLEQLKNITKGEAETFAKIAQSVVISGDSAFLLNPDKEKYLEKEFNINFSELLLMRDLGIIHPNDLEFTVDNAVHDETDVFIYGPACILLERSIGVPAQSIQVAVLTAVGRELVNLITIEPKQAYIKKIASLFKRNGVIIKQGKVDPTNDKGIKIDEIEIVLD